MSPRASRRPGRSCLPPERARVLYLSYDGMCDPLGGSQILPYLSGLAKLGHRISLISFEKAHRSAEERAAVSKACLTAGINWQPLPYHKRPPVLSAMYDVRRMRQAAEELQAGEPFDIVHCRSYLPALVGLRLKRLQQVRFLFDMRGFWADERVDGGIWNLGNPLIRAVYRYFKRREAEFLAEADHVISLTEEGKAILLARREDPAEGPPITVVPCCVDFDLFPPVTSESRAIAREGLGIPHHAKVIVYLGSFGSWYMVEEMMDFFRVQREREPDAIFLIISREPAEEILACAEARSVPAASLIVRSASRHEVPKLAAAADYGLFFIKPVFSKKASSPTKMGELLALELPVVANSEIGDVGTIVEDTGAGVLVDRFEEDAYRTAIENVAGLKPDMRKWREAARRWFDLDLGVSRYDEVYQTLIAEREYRSAA